MAAWIQATVFELGCFFAAQAEHMGAMQGAVWLPLIWLSVLRLRVFNTRWLAVLVVSLAMTVLAGLPQVAVAAFASAACLAVLLAVFRWSSWKSAAVVLPACVWAVLLAAIQFWPTAELTQNSIAKYRAEWIGSGGGMPPGALLSLVMPNYWHVFDPTKISWTGGSGVLVIVLQHPRAGAGDRGDFLETVESGSSIRRDACDLHAGDAGRSDGGGTGNHCFALPEQIRIGIHPEFFFCIFSLALAVLAGLGAERLLRSSRLQIAAGIVIACDLILVSSGRPMNEECGGGLCLGSRMTPRKGTMELIARIRETNQPLGSAVAALAWHRSELPGFFGQNVKGPILPFRPVTAAIRWRLSVPSRLGWRSPKGSRWGSCYQVEKSRFAGIADLMNARFCCRTTR